ncbi:MAG TPA: PilN domain-containing protein [Xanthobacteraceae bacterium]|nr:PilN domain-containing protein [Xanthobacteraceae bacterium]
MNLLTRIVAGFSLWIDSVAGVIIGLHAKLRPSRTVDLVEQDTGVFAVGGAGSQRVRIGEGELAGAMPESLATSRAELVLRPDRFVFRPLELPRRAGEFLDGIIRAQIDRLTPWSPADAVFGWSAPADIANDRIVVTVVATARALIEPLVRAITGAGANAISISTVIPGTGPDPVPITVFEQQLGGAFEARRVRRVLVGTLLVAALLASAATVAAVVIGGDLEARQGDIVRRIAARHVALRANRDAGSDSVMAALARRKNETAATVIVLEALSQILPDHTYVTELRITGDKLQVVGVTRDAPSLISLIEQSSHFTRATFFAPTTRSPADPGEHFHIEARIEPVHTPQS